MIASTSASDSGDGEVAEPTKPVTRGVFRTMCQVFSSRSISTSTYPGYDMRDEITFLPPRISIVSSIGIRTRPILSWSVNASTRLSRLSFTFFSKPEYVWMMYHCIAIGFYDLSNSKNFEHVRNAALYQPVNYREKYAEERDCRDHHGRGRDDFFAARPSDLLHLQADVVQKLTRLLDCAGDLTADLARASADSALRIVVF